MLKKMMALKMVRVFILLLMFRKEIKWGFQRSFFNCLSSLAETDMLNVVIDKIAFFRSCTMKLLNNNKFFAF